jgi:hypothetical protein
MLRPSKFPGGKRGSLPHRLKAAIILRQDGRCAVCGTRLIIGFFVFDDRSALTLPDDNGDLDGIGRLAAICWTCDQRRTASHAPR